MEPHRVPSGELCPHCLMPLATDGDHVLPRGEECYTHAANSNAHDAYLASRAPITA